MALRRIQKEAKDLEAFMRASVNTADSAPDPVLGRQVVSVAVDPDDPYHWTVTVVPTVDTCMSEALFGVEVTLCVRFPQDYPFKPFAVTFDDAWLEGVRGGIRWPKQSERSLQPIDESATPAVAVAASPFAEAVGAAAGRQRDRRAIIDMEGSARRAMETEWLDDAVAMATQHKKRLAVALAPVPPVATTVVAAVLPTAAATAPVGGHGPMRIYVQMLTGRVFTFEQLPPSTTTDGLRFAVQEREGIPGNQMRFIYAGRQMEDGRTLADYGVRADSTIHLIIRLRGCQSSLLGADGVLKSDWSPALTICTLLRTVNESLFAAVPPEYGGSSCRCHLRPLVDTHATLDLVQWAGRCSSPARGVVWSPSNDARWPLLFRKIVRYVRRIAVRAESHATRRTVPLDVVERIASYL